MRRVAVRKLCRSGRQRGFLRPGESEREGRTLEVHRQGDVASPVGAREPVRVVLALDDGVDERRAVVVERRGEVLLDEAGLRRRPDDLARRRRLVPARRARGAGERVGDARRAGRGRRDEEDEERRDEEDGGDASVLREASAQPLRRHVGAHGRGRCGGVRQRGRLMVERERRAGARWLCAPRLLARSEVPEIRVRSKGRGHSASERGEVEAQLLRPALVGVGVARRRTCASRGRRRWSWRPTARSAALRSASTRGCRSVSRAGAKLGSPIARRASTSSSAGQLRGSLAAAECGAGRSAAASACAQSWREGRRRAIAHERQQLARSWRG